MNEAQHDFMVYAVSHPVALAFVEIARRLGDVVDIPALGKVVNSAEVGRAVLLDERNFSKRGPGSFGVLISQVMGESALLNMDGDPHLRLRRMLNDLFSPAYLRVIETEVLQRPAERLACSLAAGEAVDVVRFTRLLTGSTIRHMLGLPLPGGREGEDECLQTFEFTRQLTNSIGLTTRQLTTSQVAAKRVPFERLTATVADAYARDDFPEHSVIARLKRLGLTADEARGVVAAILIAGTETLSTAIPRMVALLVDSGELSELRAHPELTQSAVDETLRFVVPSPIMLRSVLADSNTGGVRFKAGERVMLLTYNMLKDASLYRDARRFDIRREQPAAGRNLWFGAGHHFCLGFALAQREMRVVLNVLVNLAGTLRIRRRRYAHGVFLPGYSRLDVEMVR